MSLYAPRAIIYSFEQLRRGIAWLRSLGKIDDEETVRFNLRLDTLEEELRLILDVPRVDISKFIAEGDKRWWPKRRRKLPKQVAKDVINIDRHIEKFKRLLYAIRSDGLLDDAALISYIEFLEVTKKEIAKAIKSKYKEGDEQNVTK